MNFTLRDLWDILKMEGGGGTYENSRVWRTITEECPWIFACLTFVSFDPITNLGSRGWYSLEGRNYARFVRLARESGLYEEAELADLERFFAEQGILNSA